MAQHTILSTKKLKPALKEELAGKGVELLEKEFITIKPIISHSKYTEIWPWMSDREEKAIVFTSQHAVDAVDRYLHGGDAFYSPDHWQLFSLNGATLERMKGVFAEDQIIATATYATELAANIIANGNFKQVVFFCGNQRLDTIPTLLTAAGIQVVEIVVYETSASPSVVTAEYDGVLFFSPSGVDSFFSANALQPETTCFAIGSTTAASLGQHTSNRIITSDTPTQESMVASAWHYLQNIDSYK
jgi:uroporphyrinogen-III synthase